MSDSQKVQDATHHKEESNARREADANDRCHMQKLAISIGPLAPSQHPDNIVNIVLGEIAPAKVNVDDAVNIGTCQKNE